MDFKDTIVALATPAGVGAIGVIRLSGDQAIDIVNAVFKPKDLATQPTHTIHYGRIESNGRVYDEVVASLYIAPKSYTKENVVEISCHGSPFIQESILQLFVEHGARFARPAAREAVSLRMRAVQLSEPLASPCLGPGVLRREHVGTRY